MNVFIHLEKDCETCLVRLARRRNEHLRDFKRRRFCVACRKKHLSEVGKAQTAGRPWNLTSKTASILRRQQISLEEQQANQLRQQGWEVFSPTVVCDRIGVKNGKVFFIDFKKRGREKLRDGQQRIHDLLPEQYLVVVHD